MSEAVENLIVSLGERSYPIHFGAQSRVLACDQLACQQPGQALIVTDENVLCAEREKGAKSLLEGGQPHWVLPAGEGIKCFAQAEEICYQLNKQGVSRDGAVFALGGGVIGDLAGFAAAIYNRGIAFYQVPTTLLAMVDSSVGGKTGINLPARGDIRGGKNLVGAFWQPKAVFIETGFLATLPEREFNAGMAEVIKYGMLADAALFEQLEKAPTLTWQSPELAGIIRQCCAIKAAVVRDDEQETAQSGGRALLNLGHTFAHAVENVAGYGEYLHGEAVGLGLVLATRLTQELGLLSSGDVDRVRALVERYQLPAELRNPLPLEQLMQAMLRDKKNRAGRLRMVTMEAIGQAVTREDVSTETIQKLWHEVGAE